MKKTDERGWKSVRFVAYLVQRDVDGVGGSVGGGAWTRIRPLGSPAYPQWPQEVALQSLLGDNRGRCC